MPAGIRFLCLSDILIFPTPCGGLDCNRFEYEADRKMVERGYFTVDKGSVTVNGVSLTVCNPTGNSFEVAIIPYTFEHTNFKEIREGSTVNIEFDILGKYIARLQSLSK